MRASILGLALALAVAMPAAAHEVTKGEIVIVHPSARPVIAGRPGVAYMAIVNDGDRAERLLGARSPDFEAADLHESYDEGGVSKMRPVEVLEIPGGDTALLEPGGMHLMLLGGSGTLKAGDEFPLVLIFENAGEIEVPVQVGDVTAGADHSGHGGHAAPATQ